ncbi:HAMP domain-containing protein, partial [bacterium]|nr:HAMP domain-containing protein [bacterium]
MKSRIKISTKLLFATVTVTVSIILINGLVTDYGLRKPLSEGVFDKLTAVRELKAQQIEDYLKFIQDQAITFSENHMVVEAMESFHQAFKELDKSAVSEVANNDSLAAYYRDEFIPRFPKSREEGSTADDLLPRGNAGRYLQHAFIADNPHPTGEKHQLTESPDGSAYAKYHAEHHSPIRNYLEKFGYYDIFLVEPENGNIVYSVFKEVDFATTLESGPYQNSNLAKVYRAAKIAGDPHAVHIVDFKPYAPSSGAMASFIASPIFKQDQLIGVLIFQMPVDRINEIMTNKKSWKDVGLGNTGESFILAKDFTMRSQSRFLIEDPENYLNTVLQGGLPAETVSGIRNLKSSIGLQTVITQGSQKAFEGEEGTGTYEGYTGEKVVSSFRPLQILGLDWAIFSEIAEKEAFLLSEKIRDRTIMTGSVLLAGAIYCSYLLALSLTRPVRQLEISAKNLTQGDLDETIQRTSGDEIGDLADAFEVMRKEMKQNISEIEKQRDGLDLSVKKRTSELDVLLQKQEQKNKELQNTQKKLIESREKTLENEQRISAIIEANADGILSIDHRGTIALFNNAAEKMFGY